MYKRVLLKAFFLILPFASIAQYQWDFGGSIGASSFLGDVGGKDTPAKKFIGDLNMPTTRFGFGVYGRYKLSPLLSFQLAVAWDRISGDDKQATYVPRRGRNLSFRNDIYEMAFTTQVYFYEIPSLITSFKTTVDFRAYGFAGVGFFHHNPTANYKGEWVDLQPLQTEGVNYSLWGVSIPAGIGCYFSVNRMHRFGLELCWRKTFTDYLDDVSTTYVEPSTLANPTAVALANRSTEVARDPKIDEQYGKGVELYVPGAPRGDSKAKDTWFTYSFTYSYAIRGKSSFYRSRYPGLFGKKNKKRKIRAKF